MEKTVQDNTDLLQRIKANPELREFLTKVDYTEQPVDIVTFITDPQYLGNATDKGTKLYDVWHKTLREVHADDNIFEVVLTGSIGTGKSACADIGLAYGLYRVLCLKNPEQYYKLLIGKSLSLVFFSMSLSLSGSNNFQSFQNKLQSSPWFMNRGVLRGNVNPVLYFDKIDYKLSSPRCSGAGMIGGDVIGGILDEINTPGESKGVKERTFAAYQSVVRRMETRFMEMGSLPGLKLYLCASKDEELSFVDQHINKRKNSTNVLVKDIKLWEAKPRAYSGMRFPVAVGDAFKVSRIIQESERAEFIKSGYTIVDVPDEHRNDFEYDLIGALRDLAGVTVAGLRRYKLFASEKFIRECFDDAKVDPVAGGTLETGLNHEVDWIHYVDLKKIRSELSDNHYIHLDIAAAGGGDAMGIACSSVKRWIEVDKENEEGTFSKVKLPVVETDFMLRVKSQEGDRIPLHMMRRFILDLRARGLHIKQFTVDLRLMSEDTIQILTKEGIPTSYLSVDRTIKPYMTFRDLVFEKRWMSHYDPWMYIEAKNVEHDRETNKIDHPEKVEEVEILQDGNVRTLVMDGSKDILDAVVASTYQCVTSERAPIKVESVKKVMDAMKSGAGRSSNPANLPDDWFVTDESKKFLKKTTGSGTIVKGQNRAEKMLEAINAVQEVI